MLTHIFALFRPGFVPVAPPPRALLIPAFAGPATASTFASPVVVPFIAPDIEGAGVPSDLFGDSLVISSGVMPPAASGDEFLGV